MTDKIADAVKPSVDEINGMAKKYARALEALRKIRSLDSNIQNMDQYHIAHSFGACAGIAARCLRELGE